MRGWTTLGLATVLAGGTLLGGCQKPLFPEDAPRSQYERFGLLRGQARPAKEPDLYGWEKPAIRDRLKPLDSP